MSGGGDLGGGAFPYKSVGNQSPFLGAWVPVRLEMVLSKEKQNQSPYHLKMACFLFFVFFSP